MIKEKAMQLVAALRSGNYTQGTNYLHTLEGRMCCLGVACAIQNGHRRPSRYTNGAYAYDLIPSGLVTAVLPEDVKVAFGFLSELGTRRDGLMINIRGITAEHLAAANDRGCSFADIADYIEANWEHL